MSGTALFVVVILVLVLVAAAIASYYIARHLRGTIKITLAKRGFNPGEQVTGSFELETRKSIEGKRLFAALVGSEVTRESYRDSNNRPSTRTHTREIYRDEQTIEEARSYPAGKTAEYQFQLNAPPADFSQGQGSILGDSLEAGLQILAGRNKHLEWSVSVRLDAEGIDLADSESITINL